MAQTEQVQAVKIVASNRNKYSTAMRAAITGRNAAADAKNRQLYRIFDWAFQLAESEWNKAQDQVF